MDLSDEVARKYGKKICDFLGVKVNNSTGMVQTPSGLKTVRGICRAIENILDEARMEEVKMDSDGYNTDEPY